MVFCIFPKKATAKCLGWPIGPRTYWNVLLDSYYVGLWYFGWNLSDWCEYYYLLCYLIFLVLLFLGNVKGSQEPFLIFMGYLVDSCGHTQGGAYMEWWIFVHFKPQHYLSLLDIGNFFKLVYWVWFNNPVHYWIYMEGLCPWGRMRMQPLTQLI